MDWSAMMTDRTRRVSAERTIAAPAARVFAALADPSTHTAIDGSNALLQVKTLAHWCTILTSLIFDGSVMRPRCRQVIALLA
jgi:hypothetical protein